MPFHIDILRIEYTTGEYTGQKDVVECGYTITECIAQGWLSPEGVWIRATIEPPPPQDRHVDRPAFGGSARDRRRALRRWFRTRVSPPEYVYLDLPRPDPHQGERVFGGDPHMKLVQTEAGTWVADLGAGLALR